MVGERPTTGSGADDDDVKMILLRHIVPSLALPLLGCRHLF